MEIKYIKEVKENTVILDGIRLNSVTEEVAISDLENISKTAQIIGYNKITKGIKVTDLNDVISTLKAKGKLLNKEDYQLEVKEFPEDYENDSKYCFPHYDKQFLSYTLNAKNDFIYEVNNETETITATIRPMLDNIDFIIIDWGKFLQHCTVEFGYLYSYSLSIVFDFKLPKICIGKPYHTDCAYTANFALRCFDISSITFTDNFDMSNTLICDGLFMFETVLMQDPNSDYNTDMIEGQVSVSTKGSVIDMGKYNAENVISAKYMFANNKSHVRYPKFSEKLTRTRGMFARKLITKDERVSLNENVLACIDRDRRNLALIGAVFEALPYKECYKYTKIGCEVRKVILDCPLSELKNFIENAEHYNAVCPTTIHDFEFTKGFVVDIEDYTIPTELRMGDSLDEYEFYMEQCERELW